MIESLPEPVVGRYAHVRSERISGMRLVCGLALIRIVLYCFAAPNYGYFRDELYYLACGEHPDLVTLWPRVKHWS